MPRSTPTKVKDEASPLDPTQFLTPALESQDLRMSYRVARGEQGVLTFEPYKSILLPHWRFKNVSIAEKSSSELKVAFDHYVSAGDLVGADMARKFIQMGMTRAKRYANHKGGRKYDRTAREVEKEGGKRTELPKSEGHDGRDEKFMASEVFKKVWRTCTSDDQYLELKKQFLLEQKEWDKTREPAKKDYRTGQQIKDNEDSDDR